VFVDRSRNLPLCPAKQSTVEENATIRDTLEILKTALLCDSFKLEVPIVNLDGHRTRRAIPAKFVAEQCGKPVIGQVLGQTIHPLGPYQVDQSEF
jgi:hypothetical protein